MLKWLKSLFQKQEPQKPQTQRTSNVNVHPSATPQTSLVHSIDVDFLRHLEGEELSGYVPQERGKVIGQSGVTISVGFDLGQWDVQSLKGRIPDSLLDKLRPYLGLQKDGAKNALLIKPLRITPEESRTLAVFAKEKTIGQLIGWLGTTRWNALDEALKTVLVSVAYQYGNLPKRCPRLFTLASGGNWVSVVHELENFGDSFPTRRKKEADYIRDNSVLYLSQVTTKSKIT